MSSSTKTKATIKDYRDKGVRSLWWIRYGLCFTMFLTMLKQIEALTQNKNGNANNINENKDQDNNINDSTKQLRSKLTGENFLMGELANQQNSQTKNDDRVSSLSDTQLPKIESLLTYLENVKFKFGHDLVLLYWNSSGILEKVSKVYFEHWLPKDSLDTVFNVTKPSKYGTLALILNKDILYGGRWSAFDTIPPIPIMFYSMPIHLSPRNTNGMFHLVPNPYDRIGNCERMIESIFIGTNATKNTISEPTYAEYMSKPSIMVWRGVVHVHHGFDSRSELVEQYKEQFSNDNKGKVLWLDAADTQSNPDKGMSPAVMSSQYKYQIDIGGITGTAWNGLRWKMCASGGLVFRVHTTNKDWWHYSESYYYLDNNTNDHDKVQTYPDLIPWEHYIPVHSNLSNLHEAYEWAEQNPERSYEIMLKGRSACLQTYKTEYARQYQRNIVLHSLPQIVSEDILEEANYVFRNESAYFFPRNG